MKRPCVQAIRSVAFFPVFFLASNSKSVCGTEQPWNRLFNTSLSWVPTSLSRGKKEERSFSLMNSGRADLKAFKLYVNVCPPTWMDFFLPFFVWLWFINHVSWIAHSGLRKNFLAAPTDKADLYRVKMVVLSERHQQHFCRFSSLLFVCDMFYLLFVPRSVHRVIIQICLPWDDIWVSIRSVKVAFPRYTPIFNMMYSG